MSKVHIHQLHQPLPAQKPKAASKPTETSFQEVLQNTSKPKISKHALERLSNRNITIADAQWEVISAKMREAKGKGVTDSLVITKEAALIVSTKNHTVVTAMDLKETENQIFTNINGTIVVDQ